LVFQRDKLIAEGEWLAHNAEIGLAYDRSPVEICIYGYYTEPKSWPLTEEIVQKYGLEPWLDDLRLVWGEFFAPPNFGVKSIHYEGPDGEEVIVRPGE
jgi:hypothetical protein